MNKPTSTHHRRFPPSKDSSPVLRFPPCEYASPRSAGRYSSRRLQWKLGEQRIPECSHGGICTVYINQYQHLYIIYHPKRNVHIIYIYIIQIKNEISSPYSIYIYIFHIYSIKRHAIFVTPLVHRLVFWAPESWPLRRSSCVPEGVCRVTGVTDTQVTHLP
jgi:hypothetical protein